MHNFEDENTYACFGKAIQKLTGSLESKCEVALSWFSQNKMIVNSGRFQAIIIDKKKQDHTNEIFKTGSKEIKIASQVKLLEVEIENKLHFK